MQALPAGSMVSVGLPEPEVRALLPAELSLAAVNAPEVCAVSGPDEAVTRFVRRLEADGVPYRLLRTSHAFHSAMMDPILDQFAAEVAGCPARPPARPYVSCLTGDWMPGEQAADPGYWARHLRHPVRFADGMARLLESGVRLLVEVGPGDTLTKLARLADGARQATVTALTPPAGLDERPDDGAVLLEGVGRMWLAGAEVDWAALHEPGPRSRVSLPGYPFERRRYWIDPPGAAASGPTADLAFDAGPEAPDEPAIDSARPPLDSEFVAPRDHAEERLAAIWQDLLGVRPVGVLDNFVELGGHSLLATKMITRIRQEFGLDIPLRALTQASTVEALARLLAQSGQESEAAEASLPAATPDWAALHEPFPLSEIQQAQWLGRMGSFSLGNVAAHMYWELERDCARLHVDPGTDLARLNRAWARVMDRHPMLRAVINADGTQQILPDVGPYVITATDLSGLAAGEAQAELDRLRDRLSHEIRPAGQWPLFDIRATVLPGRRMRIFLSFDLLMADMGSVRILLRDWRRYYEDPDAQLPALGISYRDYRAAAARIRETPQYERSLAYWRDRVAELPGPPALPLAVPPEQITAPRFEPHETIIPAAVWERITRQAARRGLTPSAVLLAAYAQVLGTWSRTGRFTLNVTTNIRFPVHPDVDELVGGFASFGLQAVDLTRDRGIEAVARQIQEQNWKDLEHRYLSGVEILRELGRQRRNAAGAVAPVVFTSTLIGDGADFQSIVEWIGDQVYAVVQTPQVWMDGAALELDDGLGLSWAAVDGLFEPGVVAEMFGAFCAVVRGLADESGAGWGPAAVALPGWQSDLVAEVNATAGPVPEGLLFSPLLEAARQRPEAVAVASAGRELSYAELCRRASWVAVQLAGQGVSPGQLVGVSASKGPEQVVAALGVLLAGAAYVPVDPELPPARRAYVLDHGQVAVVVTGPGAGPDWPAQVAVDLDDPAQVAAGPPPCAATPGDLAYVLYTSGSTGEPKGVAVCHRAALNTCADICDRFGLGPADRVLGLSSLSFDLSVWDIFGVLGAGGALILPEPGARRDPARWRQLATDHQVTVWNSVPALMEMFTETCAATPGGPPPGLRLVLMSGDWIPVGLPGRIRALWPHCEVISLGGATEAAIWSIWHRAGDPEPGWDSVPYGKPLRNQTWQVLNDRLEPCPVWVTGELFIGGTGLAEGYWRDEERTAAAFFPHPATGERLYRTGDLGRRHPDGTIEFLGRQDSQVKIGGYRIELGEIETVLAAAPGVAAAIAGTAGDRHHRRLVAAIIPAPGQPRNPAADTTRADAARQHARQHLPAYMIPAAITTIDQLPLTANGKVNRNALTTTPPPPHQPSHPPATTTPTQQAIIGRLSALVAEVAGLDQVDPEANFFETGGDSITGVRIISRAADEGLEIRLQDLFEAQSLAELAIVLEARGVTAAPAGSGAVPLTPSQQHLLGQPAGIHRIEVPVAPGLTPEQAQRAVTRLVERHPSLRSRFTPGPDGWTQHFAGAGEVDAYVPLLELGMLPETMRPAAAAEMLAEMRAELDLEQGPVFKAALFDLGGQRRLAWLIHELAADMPSCELLLAEFLRLTAPCQNGAAALMPPTTSFAAWAARRPGPDLPPGPPPPRPQPSAQPARQVLHAELDEAETARLLSSARDAYRLSLTELCLAALALARSAAGWAAADVEVVTDPRADAGGETDISRSVGAFSAAAPVRLDFAPAGPGELLAAVKQLLRGEPAGPAGRRAGLAQPREPLVILRSEGDFGGRSGLDRLLGPDARPWPQPEGGPAAAVLTVLVYRGRLHAEWSWPGPAPAGAGELAGAFTGALRTLADHCREAGPARPQASDFPLAGLADGELSRLLGALGGEEEL